MRDALQNIELFVYHHVSFSRQKLDKKQLSLQKKVDLFGKMRYYDKIGTHFFTFRVFHQGS